MHLATRAGPALLTLVCCFQDARRELDSRSASSCAVPLAEMKWQPSERGKGPLSGGRRTQSTRCGEGVSALPSPLLLHGSQVCFHTPKATLSLPSLQETFWAAEKAEAERLKCALHTGCARAAALAEEKALKGSAHREKLRNARPPPSSRTEFRRHSAERAAAADTRKIRVLSRHWQTSGGILWQARGRRPGLLAPMSLFDTTLADLAAPAPLLLSVPSHTGRSRDGRPRRRAPLLCVPDKKRLQGTRGCAPRLGTGSGAVRRRRGGAPAGLRAGGRGLRRGGGACWVGGGGGCPSGR